MSISFTVVFRSPLCLFAKFLLMCKSGFAQPGGRNLHCGPSFWHFQCLPTTSTDEITSHHRHSPMIFRSENQEKSMDGANVTLFALCNLQSFCSTHHPNMEQHVYHFYDQLQGSTMDFFIFSVLCLGRVCAQLVTLSVISMSSTHIQR